MVQSGEMTKFQRFRLFTGALVLCVLLSRVLTFASDVPYMPWECKPENWWWWVEYFGDLAGYMRWLTCSLYGLP